MMEHALGNSNDWSPDIATSVHIIVSVLSFIKDYLLSFDASAVNFCTYTLTVTTAQLLVQICDGLILYLTIHHALVKSQSAFFFIFFSFYRKFSLQTHLGLTQLYQLLAFADQFHASNFVGPPPVYISTFYTDAFSIETSQIASWSFCIYFPRVFAVWFGVFKVLKWINIVIIIVRIWELRCLILKSQVF